jgi:hypothetical protein
MAAAAWQSGETFPVALGFPVFSVSESRLNVWITWLLPIAERLPFVPHFFVYAG